MTEHATKGSRWLRAIGFFACWTLLGLAFGSQVYIRVAGSGHSPSWGPAIALGLRDWYLWALFWPLLRRVARTISFSRSTLARDVFLHLVAALACVVVYEGLSLLATELLEHLNGGPLFPFSPHGGSHPHPSSGLGRLGTALSFRTYFDLLTYFVLICVSLAIDYAHRLRERERRGIELEARLTATRLQALRMQLNPHFLFNTLNSISALVHTDPHVADEMIGSLSELLRLTLSTPERQEVTLAEELSFLDRYLEIEQLRFGDRLQVKRRVPIGTQNVLVPSLLLQPLVENAIRHGIENQIAPGTIRISAERAGPQLLLQVQDNGRGLPPAAAGNSKEGVGLTNTRERLKELYGEAGQLNLTTPPEGGFLVEVRVPWKTGTVADRPAEH